MNSNENIYILVNYSLGNTESIEALEAAFSNLNFSKITPGLYTVEFEDENRAEFERFRSQIDFVISPTLYGLNAEEALEVSNISSFHNYPYGELRGKGILLGFVDTGIDYMNPLFQNADGTTRIATIWDQTIEGSGTSEFNYGTVYEPDSINQAIKSADPYAIVPSRDEIGHGTFLAGVAAGNDQTDNESFKGGAPDSNIVMVKLRQSSSRLRQYYMVDESVPAYQANDILTGVNFLVQVATRLKKPIAICIGVGNNLGAHNGTGIMEGFLQGISSASDVILVIAAGNEANSGHHYEDEIKSMEAKEVEINVAEDERGIFIYLWTDIASRLLVSVKSPLGQVIDKIPIRTQVEQTFRFNLEQAVLNVRYLYPDPLSGTEEIIIRLLTPTPGIWTLTVYSDINVDGIFHLWLPRKGFIKNGTRFLKPTPDTTVQLPGTGEYPIVIGAYDYQDDSVYVASGRGKTTNGIYKPDLIAPGVNVRGPSIQGGFTTYVGTSTAAAITASACALLLEWAILNGNLPEMNTRIARGILIKGARRKTGTIYPNTIEGYGRLDLKSSIEGI